MPPPVTQSNVSNRIPDPLFFVFYNIVDATHPVNNHPNIHQIARVRVDVPSWDKPPGYANRSHNITGIAQTIGDWFEYLGYVRGSGWFGTGCYMGAVMVHNFGTHNHFTTMGYPTGGLLDQIEDGCGTGVYRRSTFYAATGIARARAWADQFLPLLKSELDSRNLCYPWLFNEDIEVTHGTSPAEEILHSTTGNYGHGVYVHDGSWTDMINDPRNTTETLYERRENGTRFVPVTLTGLLAKYYADGNPAPNITGLPYFQGVNQSWYNFWTPAAELCKDYAIYKSWYEPVKAIFPESRVCNYGQLFAHYTGGYGLRDVINPFVRYSSGLTDARLDYFCPTLYGPIIVNRYHVPSTIYGSTTGEVYKNFVASRLTAISGSNRSIIPWCPVPDELSAAYTNGNQYIYNADDIAYVMLSGYQHLGIRMFSIFSGDTSATTGDRIMKLYNTFIQGKEAARPSRARMRMRSGVSEA
jgi:hypothetical protein